MAKKSWSTQEMERLCMLSKECPPSVIAKELARPVTSVRKKLREIGVTYVKGDEWKRKQVQMLISDEARGELPRRNKQELTEEAQVLNEFWTTLLSMASVAKKKGKRVDVLSFIDTYRKIKLGG
ncbi:hypothetical protein ACFVVQ_14640 [Paenibacillus chitinolyticus]|uniref:Uncharacterized protein n=1 Tax=Paenibacillus chitinolyticus TaxID=79263 RepID=A0A410X2Z8_9BACL|nr:MULTISPECIES: hypothetical protein [Paenibacillus]EPD89582.1 hypothetical protein HMPREF1207_01624 [Paenibacillus sp. HGH0039]MBV6712048.1 hypothetical protein [Paenibacillus chitinolyticus]MCY9593773.1 hypothetical protein [Paenibacillus chitinolyticus]MCY9599278.1 hypothetical protein [Paenibacillus chitinolyticus]MEC0248605.1 hypothetical protein [Paenibacillus chitinolyticus]